jgi:hypothetical protein
MCQITLLTLDHYYSYYHPVPHLAPDVMQTLGNMCANLCHLSLESIGLFSKKDLEVLLHGLKVSLIDLKLGDFDHKHLSGHSRFIHCTLLEKLWMKNGAEAEDMLSIGQLQSLKELKIKMLRSSSSFYITDEDYKLAFKQQQLISLQQFMLSGDNNFGKKAVMSLLTCCPKLIKWSSYVNSQIKGLQETVSDLGPQEIHLQNLDLQCKLDSICIMAVTSLCHLRELYICGGYYCLSEQDFRLAFHQGNLINLAVIKL